MQRGLQVWHVLLELHGHHSRGTKGRNAGSQAHIVVVTSVPDTTTLVRVQQAAERAVVVLADLQGQRTRVQAPTVQLCSLWQSNRTACCRRVGSLNFSWAQRYAVPGRAQHQNAFSRTKSKGPICEPRGELLGMVAHPPLHLSHGAVRLCYLGPEGLVDLLAPAAQVEGQGAGGDGPPDPASAALAADVHLDLPMPRVGRIIL